MADTVYAFKPEQGRLSGGSFEKQVEYFLNHLRGSVTEEIETLTTSINTLLDNYNNLSARVTALQDTVNGHESRISVLETDNTTNKNNIADLQDRVTVLERASSSTSADLNTLRNRISALEQTAIEHDDAIKEQDTRTTELEERVETHRSQIEELEYDANTLQTTVNSMNTLLAETNTIALAGRHASVYTEATEAAWFKVAETDPVGEGGTLQLNILAQPVGEQDGPAFTWMVAAAMSDDGTTVESITSTGHTDESVPDGMADNFVVTTWHVDDDDPTITSYTFQIQFQTTGTDVSNGWTDWTTVEVTADTSSTTFDWEAELVVGTEVTGLVANETNVRMRLSDADADVVEGTLSGSLELLLSDGSVVSISRCAPNYDGTGLSFSGTFTTTRAASGQYFALWCHVPAGNAERGWKFTVDAEASRDYLESTIWTLYQLREAEDDGLAVGVDAIPDTETVIATTFMSCEDRFVAVEAKNTEQDDRLTTLESEMDAVEAKNTEQDDRLTTLENTVSSHTTSIGTLESNLADLENDFDAFDPVPDGLIALVNTDTIPDGFVLCDGTNDTPDLSGYVTDTLHYVQKA